jgi:hypothetical protein
MSKTVNRDWGTGIVEALAAQLQAHVVVTDQGPGTKVTIARI